MKVIIDELIDNTRIDNYLVEIIPNKSRSKIQAEIKKGQILINSKIVKPSYILKDNDVLEINDNIFEEKAFLPQPENIALEVVWEDENMAVINKPSGMLTHPTSIEMSGTLVNALLQRYRLCWFNIK